MVHKRNPQGSASYIHINTILRIALILIAYIFLFVLLDLLARRNQILYNVVTWYPPAGVSFALLLGLKWEYAPALIITSLISRLFIYQVGLPFETILLWAILVASIYGVTSVFLQRRLHFDPQLRSMRDVIYLIVASVIVAGILSVTAILIDPASASLSSTQRATTLFAWWVRDTVGILVITPFLLIYVMPWVKQFSEGTLNVFRRGITVPLPPKRLVWSTVTLLVTLYLGFGVPALHPLNLEYLIAIPLIWMALEYGLKGASFGILILNFVITFIFPPAGLDQAGIAERQLLRLVISTLSLLTGAVRTERMEVAEELRQSEKRFRALVENSLEEVSLVSAEGNLIYESPTAQRPLGYPSGSLIGHNMFELLHPEDRATATQLLEQVMQEPGAHREGLFRLQHQNGSWRWMEGVVTNLLEDPAVQTLVINYRDVTERKQAEDSLQASEDRYRDLVEHSQDLICTHDLEGRLLSVNPFAEQLLGYSSDSLLQMNIYDLLTPESQKLFHVYLYQLRKRGFAEGTMNVLTKQGEKRVWEYRNTLRTEGVEQPIVRGMARDVTERKKAELRIQHLTRLYATLSQVNNTIVRVKNRSELFQTICNVAVENGKFGLAWIGLVDLETGQVTPMAVHGTAQSYLPFQAMNINEMLFNEGITSLAIKTRQIAYSRDIQTDHNMQQWREVATEGGFHSAAAVPFRLNGELSGLLNLYAADVDFFTDEEQHSLLEEMGQDISFALDTIEIESRRKYAEEALRQSEERFASAFRSSPTAITITRVQDGKVIEVNDGWVELFGYTRKEALGRTSVELGITNAETRQNIQDRLKSEGAIRNMDASVNTRNGEERDVLFSMERVEINGDMCALTTLIDVTERKQAGDALQQTSQLLQSIVGAAPLAIITYDPGGLVRTWNAAATAIFGWSEQEAIGRLPPYVPREMLPEFQTFRAQTMQGNPLTSIELQHQKKDGTLIDINLNTAPLYDNTGQASGYIAIIEDITQRKRAQEALREKEQLLSQAQRIGHIGSCSYDIANGRFQGSDEMYRLFDVSREELQPTRQAFLALIYASDRPLAAKWLDDIQTGGRTKEVEFRILRKNGELRYLQCSGAMEFDVNGKPARWIATMQDVTERKLAEIQIRQQLEQLTALREIDLAISSSFSLNVTLEIVISKVISQLQVDAADILLLESDEQTLSYAAGKGFHTNAIESARLRMADCQPVRERRLIRIEKLENKPDARLLTPLGVSERFVCYFGVPLIVKGKAKGVLEIFHRGLLHPYAEWLDFLNTLAGQAAIAIENVQLFENLEQSNIELSQAYDATIEGWSRALDLRDKETEGHTRRVTEITLKLAGAFGLPQEKLLHIRWGALLHDIGKMGVPDNILLKPGPLTEEEWKRMKSHPQYAYDLLKPIIFLAPALDIPYCHHEKWDGTGYPRGLKGEEIPLVARLFAVVDVWDALCSDRPYRPAWAKEKVIEHIRTLSGTHFDPNVVKHFLEMLNK